MLVCLLNNKAFLINITASCRILQGGKAELVTVLCVSVWFLFSSWNDMPEHEDRYLPEPSDRSIRAPCLQLISSPRSLHHPPLLINMWGRCFCECVWMLLWGVWVIVCLQLFWVRFTLEDHSLWQRKPPSEWDCSTTACHSMSAYTGPGILNGLLCVCARLRVRV